MSNAAIPRETVHRFAEACSDDPLNHQSTALRLLKDQRRLSRWFEQNAATIGAVPVQVASYMLSVTLRIFELSGGRLSRVTTDDLDRATVRVQARTDALLPADKGFGARAKTVEDRAQPHILDEILWALYEREDKEKRPGEADMDPADSALAYLLLWTAVEALDANWQPPKAV